MMLLLKGEKGLFASDSKRVYFPDKSWGISKECLIHNIEIVLDKGTYAFIKAEPIETEAIGIGDINTIGLEGVVMATIGDSKVFIRSTDQIMEVMYKSGGYIHTYNFRPYPALRNLYESGTQITASDYIDSLTSIGDTTEVLINALGRFPSVKSLTLIDDKYICVNHEYGVHTFCGVTKKGRLQVLPDLICRKLGLYDSKVSGSNSKTFEVKDIHNKMIELRVGNMACTDGLNDYVSAMYINNECYSGVLHFFNSSNFSFDWYNSSEAEKFKELVKNDFDTYNKKMQTAMKKLSGKSAIEFAKTRTLRHYILR